MGLREALFGCAIGVGLWGCGNGDATSSFLPSDSDGGSSGGAAADAGVVPLDGNSTDVSPDAQATDAASPYVTITSPHDGDQVPNPVTFQFVAGGGVQTVWFEAEQAYPLQTDPIPVSQGSITYKFSGVNTLRHITVQGRDALSQTIATDEVSFTPVSCVVADQPGFNHYTVAVINDTSDYPKDG